MSLNNKNRQVGDLLMCDNNKEVIYLLLEARGRSGWLILMTDLTGSPGKKIFTSGYAHQDLLLSRAEKD